MFPLFTSFLKTVTGRTVAGLAVASMSVGGVAAAGTAFQGDDGEPSLEGEVEQEAPETGSDVEGTDGASDEPVIEETEEPEESGEPATDGSDEDVSEEPGEPGTEPIEETDGEGVETDEDVDGELEAGEAPKNHGQVVSEFVHSTEFEGCEKGQAVAAVARKDFIPGEDDPEDLAAAVAEKCGTDDLLEVVIEDADDPEDATEADDGATERAGKPDDHPGKANGKADKANGKADKANGKAGKANGKNK